MFSAASGYLTQREADYQAARAKGGVALTVLGTNVVHPSSTRDHGVLANLDDSYIPGYRLVADAVHEYGAVLFAQLNHQGGVAERRATPPLEAPSPIPSAIHHDVPHALDVELIHEIARAFGAAAERCQRAGVDGVLVHAAHGYLLNQFLSPLTNQRTDEYGGSAENRMRFLFQVLGAIRAAVGETYPVGVRLNVHEYLPGGIMLNESLPIAERLDASGLIDYLDVSCGVDSDWMSEARHYPSMYFPPATWIELAAEVKKRIRIPVSCAGRIRTPVEAEELIAAGKIDLAQMARALIADPELPNKARTAHHTEIRQCMYISSGCLGRLHRGLPISCVQNPTVGRERAFGEITPSTARRVVIIGGGPAGMQAAVTARQRGHSVILFESEMRLGGQMRIAANAPGRDELLLGIQYLERQLQNLGVDVRLGVEANIEQVLAERPDAVIVATGSTAARFPSDASNVYSVREVLEGQAQVGHNVVVLDGLGRIAAASAADYLASQRHLVTIVTHGYAVGEKIDDTTRPIVEQRLRNGQVRVITGTDVIGMHGGVTLRDAFTLREWSLEADTLVHDLGGRARDELYHTLVVHGITAYRVGDCLAPRGLEEAYQEGFEVAFSL